MKNAYYTVYKSFDYTILKKKYLKRTGGNTWKW